jgi:hypothetical protein
MSGLDKCEICTFMSRDLSTESVKQEVLYITLFFVKASVVILSIGIIGGFSFYITTSQSHCFIEVRSLIFGTFLDSRWNSAVLILFIILLRI